MTNPDEVCPSCNYAYGATCACKCGKFPQTNPDERAREALRKWWPDDEPNPPTDNVSNAFQDGHAAAREECAGMVEREAERFGKRANDADLNNNWQIDVTLGELCLRLAAEMRGKEK